ncbi:MAG TPA: hypothetical protein VN137_08840 [Sphingomonas sp.]|nr:hypothetical protein [Sphingomonas sp.]
MVQPPGQARRDSAEDLWLVCHEIWLKPLEWLTAWWNAFIVPTSCHRTLHEPAIAPGPRLVPSKPVAVDSEENLFA